jgi:hypothetical protein
VTCQAPDVVRVYFQTEIEAAPFPPDETGWISPLHMQTSLRSASRELQVPHPGMDEPAVQQLAYVVRMTYEQAQNEPWNGGVAAVA